VTRVKICGLTRRSDAFRAADLGAEALGFVFAPKSRRRADPELVARIGEEMPASVTLVGVFQDQPLSEVLEVARRCRLDLVQLHGTEDPEYVRRVGTPVLKAVSVACRADLRLLERYPGESVFLLDGASAGGGVPFEWSWAVEAKRYGRIVLAGGLHPGNVEEAIRTVTPWAVDVCSGTEAAPGIKDPEKMRSFLSRVREVDRELGGSVDLEAMP
jgi:phosphoribosylanthranilate isomerase